MQPKDIPLIIGGTAGIKRHLGQTLQSTLLLLNARTYLFTSIASIPTAVFNYIQRLYNLHNQGFDIETIRSPKDNTIRVEEENIHRYFLLLWIDSLHSYHIKCWQQTKKNNLWNFGGIYLIPGTFHMSNNQDDVQTSSESFSIPKDSQKSHSPLPMKWKS